MLKAVYCIQCAVEADKQMISLSRIQKRKCIDKVAEHLGIVFSCPLLFATTYMISLLIHYNHTVSVTDIAYNYSIADFIKLLQEHNVLLISEKKDNMGQQDNRTNPYRFYFCKSSENKLLSIYEYQEVETNIFRQITINGDLAVTEELLRTLRNIKYDKIQIDSDEIINTI